MSISKNDRHILRELGQQVAEIALLPVHNEKIELWKALNTLKPVRPMVMIDQVCWNEMNIDEELVLRCTDTECQKYETQLRRLLFQWKYFPVDMVVEPVIKVPKSILGCHFGVFCQDETTVSDPSSIIMGHRYINQFETEDDLQKICMPKISHDYHETERRLAVAHDLFDGVLEVQSEGACLQIGTWDLIATWMGMENALYALVDNPDFMHRLVARITNGYMTMIDQLEEQGLLCRPQSVIHCTGAWTDELPRASYNSERPRTTDIWGCGLAQMLSTVSPAMFKEFEVDYVKHIFQRFNLVYYGCCEALDGKMNEVRMIPNVRKISMSPWCNQERGAKEIGHNYVFSRKANPVYVATDSFNSDDVRTDLLATRSICDKYGCPLEIILKDISTVSYRPENLFEWGRIAMRVVNGN